MKLTSHTSNNHVTDILKAITLAPYTLLLRPAINMADVPAHTLIGLATGSQNVNSPSTNQYHKYATQGATANWRRITINGQENCWLHNDPQYQWLYLVLSVNGGRVVQPNFTYDFDINYIKTINFALKVFRYGPSASMNLPPITALDVVAFASDTYAGKNGELYLDLIKA